MKRQAATSLVVTALLAAGLRGRQRAGHRGHRTLRAATAIRRGATPPAADPATTALFQPLQGVLPYPTDVYFSGSHRRHAEHPAGQRAHAAARRASTSSTASPRTRSSARASRRRSTPASLTASSVRIVQVKVDNATKATVGVAAPLVLGTDPATRTSASASPPTLGVGNTILEIRPLKPLVPSTGAHERGLSRAAHERHHDGERARPLRRRRTTPNFKAALPDLRRPSPTRR